MLSKPIQDALNEQIKREVFSAHSYLAMTAYFEHANFPGFAKWTRLQYEEEIAHGMRLFDFIHARRGRAAAYGIDPQLTISRHRSTCSKRRYSKR